MQGRVRALRRHPGEVPVTLLLPVLLLACPWPPDERVTLPRQAPSGVDFVAMPVSSASWPAGEWISDNPPIACVTAAGKLWVKAVPARWPNSLPLTVTCSQGLRTIRVRIDAKA